MTRRNNPDRGTVADREVIAKGRSVILKRKTLTGGVRVRTVVREDEAVIERLSAGGNDPKDPN